ncbi:hypothetical protein BJ742DRAFT_813784 [Cladochytrium replicatum]|nr:hypothetical protein BJ742DRAFT_813784 [Cladochytrium replicatum]
MIPAAGAACYAVDSHLSVYPPPPIVLSNANSEYGFPQRIPGNNSSSQGISPSHCQFNRPFSPPGSAKTDVSNSFHEQPALIRSSTHFAGHYARQSFVSPFISPTLEGPSQEYSLGYVSPPYTVTFSMVKHFPPSPSAAPSLTTSSSGSSSSSSTVISQPVPSTTLMEPFNNTSPGQEHSVSDGIEHSLHPKQSMFGPSQLQLPETVASEENSQITAAQDPANLFNWILEGFRRCEQATHGGSIDHGCETASALTQVPHGLAYGSAEYDEVIQFLDLLVKKRNGYAYDMVQVLKKNHDLDSVPSAKPARWQNWPVYGRESPEGLTGPSSPNASVSVLLDTTQSHTAPNTTNSQGIVGASISGGPVRTQKPRNSQDDPVQRGTLRKQKGKNAAQGCTDTPAIASSSTHDRDPMAAKKMAQKTDRGFRCSFADCGTIMTGWSNLMQHEKIHDPNNRVVCTERGCGVSCSNDSSLKRHRKALHKSNTEAEVGNA